MAADETTPLLRSNSSSSKMVMLRLQACATLGASLLGTGLLAQPKACSSTGLVLFVVLSILALCLSHLCAMMLCRTSMFLSSTSRSELGYADVVSLTLGRAGELGTMWAIAIMQIGCCVAYLVVIGDTFTPLIDHWTHGSHRPSALEIIFIVAILILAPLCVFVRDLASFKYTSAAAMLVIMFFAAVVVGNGVVVLTDNDPNEKRRELIGGDDVDLTGPELWPKGYAALQAIPLISFAYFMHFNVLPVLSTLRELGGEAEIVYGTVSRVSFLMSGTVTITFGIFGYLTFVSETQSDILTNFRVSGTYISSFLNIVRALYGSGLMLAYPIVLWEARENLKRIILGNEMKVTETSLSSSLLQSDESGLEVFEEASSTVQVDKGLLLNSFRVHAIFSLAIVLVTATLGSLVTDLEVVFGLVGCTCTPVIAYILPALVYLKSGAAAKNGDELSPKIACAVGAIFVPFGLTIWILGRMGKL